MKNLCFLLIAAFVGFAAEEPPSKPAALQYLNPATDGKKERPYSFGHKVKKLRKVPVIESGVTKQMLKEHLEKEADNSMQVALSVNVHHKASEVGLWERLPDGGRLWRVGICSENAKGIGFMLYDFRVPEGAKLFAYNKNRDFVVGPIEKTNSPIKESRVRYAPVHVSSIMGEEIYLEHYEPASAKDNVDFYIMQISHRWGDFPYGMTHKLQTKPEVKTVPITQEDYDKYLKTRGPNMANLIYRKVNYDLSNSGTWEELPNGDRIWRLIIEAPDFGVESHLVPYFETMLIPPGAKLFVYDPDGMATYDAMVKRNHNILYIPGNTMIVEYYEPKLMKGMGRLNIESISKEMSHNDGAKSFSLPVEQEVPFVTNPITSEAEKRLKAVRGADFGWFGFEVRDDLDNMWVAEDLPNGDKLWRLGVRLDFAKNFDMSIDGPLPKDAFLQAYTPDKATVTPPLRKLANGGYVHMPSLKNNEVVVEYYEPKNASSKGMPKILRVGMSATYFIKGASGAKLPIENCEAVTCTPNTICFDDGYVHSGKKIPNIFHKILQNTKNMINF